MVPTLTVAGQGPVALWAALEAVHRGARVVLALPGALRVPWDAPDGVAAPDPADQAQAAWAAWVRQRSPLDDAALDAHAAAAQRVVALLDRMGVPWDRSPEGTAARHPVTEGGPRVLVRAGPRTAALIHKALAQQVLGALNAGHLVLMEHHPLLALQDGGDGTSVTGALVAHVFTREVVFLPGPVVLASSSLADLGAAAGIPWNAAAAVALHPRGLWPPRPHGARDALPGLAVAGAWNTHGPWDVLPAHTLASHAEDARSAVAAALAAQGSPADAPPAQAPAAADGLARLRDALDALAARRGTEHPLALRKDGAPLWLLPDTVDTRAAWDALDARWSAVDGVDHSNAPHNGWPVRIHLLGLAHQARGMLLPRAPRAEPPPAEDAEGAP